MPSNKASSQADLLYPYLLKRFQRFFGNGHGGGGSAVSGGRLATLQDVNLGTLTDGQVLTYDGTTAMWRNEDATGGSGGGPTYIAGNGIDISGTTISTKHDTVGGIGATSAGLYLKKPSDSGLILDSTGVKIGAGVGLDVLGNFVSVDATEITDTTRGLGVNSNLIYVRTEAGGGIEFAGDGSVRVDEDADFLWTGTHQFNSPVQMHTDINFIAADRQFTSSAGIDVTWNLGGDLMLASAKTERSTDYLDGIPINGYSLHINSGGFRQLTTHAIKADELHVRTFIADTVRVDVGEEYWGKSMGIVYQDFTVPAIGATVAVTFEDSVALVGALFANGDWIMISSVEVGTGLEVNQLWGQVSGYVPLAADINGITRQRWTYTHRAGTPGIVVKKGRLAVDFGVSGQGYVHLSTLDSADGPWIRIGDWTGANPYAAGNSHIRTQIGLLDGIGDADLNPTGWGLYSDNAYLHGMLRTAETVLDDDGLAILMPTLPGGWAPGIHSEIAWWFDVLDRSANPPASIAGYQLDTGSPPVSNRLELEVRKTDDADYSYLSLNATDDGGPIGSTNIRLVSTGNIYVEADLGVIFEGAVLPEFDVTFDLGSASKRWRNLYIDHLFVSGTIAGDTLSGAEWEYPGSMIIDAHAATPTVVSVTNQGSGTASLDVEGNITLGGTVDGIDISAHAANPAAHHALATAGDGLLITGQQLRVDPLLAGGGLTYTAGGILAVGAGSGIVVAANSIAIDPSYAMPTTRRVDTAAPLTGGGELSVDLTLGLTLAPAGGLGITGGLGLAPSVAGDGLTLTAGVLAVGVGAGLVAGADAVTLAATLAGAGLTLTTGVLAVGAGDGLVANADTMALDPLVGGAGLTYTAGVLAVGTGVGIQVNANDIQIVLASPSGLNTTSGLAIDAALAGAGLALSAAKALSVNAAKGVKIGAGADVDNVIVDTAYNFTWTGTHQFDSNVKLNAGLDFIGSTRSITSPAATNLSIIPGGDLILDPGGFNVLPGGGTRTDFGDYNRKWATIYARELYVETLVASSVMATIGGRIMVTPTSSLISDITAGQTTIDLKHNVASFTTGTYLYLESAPGGVAQIEAMKITSATPTAVTGPPAGWRYTVTRGLNTSGAKTWLAGDAVVSLGATTSEGYIDLASVQTVKPISPTVQKVGPTITIYSRSATTNWDDLVPTVTMGNLTSFVDYSSTRYGFATGNDLTKAPDDPSTPFIGMTADRVNGMRLFNTPLNLYNVGNAILSIDKVNGISFEFGTALFNTIGWYEDLGIPPTAPLVAKLLGTVGVSRATATYTELDLVAQGIAGSNTLGAVRLRAINSTTVAYNLWLDSSGAYFGTGAASAARPSSGGFITDAIQYLSGNVGIGASDPYSHLEVHSTSAAAERGLTVSQVSNNTFTPVLALQKARGTRASKTIVADGDYFGSMQGYAWDGAAWVPPAGIVFQVDGTPAAGAIPGKILFQTGLTVQSGKMVLDANGNLGIGNLSPAQILDISRNVAGGLTALIRNTSTGTTAAATWRSQNDLGTSTYEAGIVSSLFAGGAGALQAGDAYVQGNTTRLVLRTVGAGQDILLATGNVERMRLDAATGFASIGGLASPTHTLHVYSNNTAIAGVGIVIQQAGAGDARLQFTQQTTNWTIGIDGSLGDSFSVSPSTDLSTATGLTVKTTGFTGINNSAPGALLHLGTLTPTLNTNANGIWIAPNATVANLHLKSSGAEGGLFLHSTNVGYVGTWTNHNFVLRTNNLDRLAISAAGTVTISTGLLQAFQGINLGNTTLSDYAETPVAYTPVVSATTTAPTVGYGTRYGNYTRIGNMVMFNAYIPVTSRSGGTGNMTVSLPPSQPARAGTTQIISAAYFDGTIWNTTKATLRTSDCTVGAGANGADLTIANVLAGHTVAVWGTYFL